MCWTFSDGTGLREFKRKNKGLKLSDGKSVGSHNKFTDKMVDKNEKLLWGAICNNNGNLVLMQNSVSQILNIQDSKSLNEHHSL